jgi:hypothetical protein
MKNRLTSLLADILRRPVFWGMNCLVERLRNVGRYDGAWFWNRNWEAARRMPELWDRIKKDLAPGRGFDAAKHP